MPTNPLSTGETMNKNVITGTFDTDPCASIEGIKTFVKQLVGKDPFDIGDVCRIDIANEDTAGITQVMVSSAKNEQTVDFIHRHIIPNLKFFNSTILSVNEDDGTVKTYILHCFPGLNLGMMCPHKP